MKIIEPGKHMSLEWEGAFHCTGKGNGGKGCDAKLEIQESDLFGTYSSSMGRDETRYITFMCPCCGALTDVASTDGYRHPDLPINLHPKDFPNIGTDRVKKAKAHLRETGQYKNPKEFT